MKQKSSNHYLHRFLNIQSLKQKSIFDMTSLQIFFLKMIIIIGCFVINVVGIYAIVILNHTTRGIIDMISSLSLVACWFILKTKNGYIACSYILLLGLMVSAWTSIMLGSALEAGKYFPFIFPLMAFFLNRRQIGVIWCSFFLMGELVIVILNNLRFLPAAFEPRELCVRWANLLIVTVIGYFISYRYEKMNDKLFNQAYYDHHTALPNRSTLMIDLSDKCCMIMIISLDDFKEINALFGYETGDIILNKIARQLEEVGVTYNLKTYRLSGSEFALLGKLNDCKEKLKMEAVGAQIIQEIHDSPVDIQNKQINLHISIGIGFNLKNSSYLLHNADLALKLARKSHYRLKVIESSRQSIKDYEDFLHISSVLHQGIELDRIFPYFQPIFNNKTGKILKFESLVRLTDDLGTLYQPAAFLECAKRTHVYSKLTRIMFNKIIRTMQNNELHFSINISYEDLKDNLTSHLLIKTLKEYPEMANRLTFEILESESIEDKIKAAAIISILSSMGCKIAIDDFGSGYANFDYLVHFSFDYLKIDGTLIQNIDHDKNSEIIVENIVRYARKSNIKTIAEFVHNEKVHKKVIEMGIDYSQGYFLGKPGNLIGFPRLI